MAERMKPITFEDAKIRWLNFSGKEGRYNRPGDRNFTLFVTPQQAEGLKDLGLNVKFKEPREGYEEQGGDWILKVKVKYTEKARPPAVWLVTQKGKTALDESDINILDYADIKKVDLVLQPSPYEASFGDGITVYLKSIFVTINEDDLDLKYADVPDSAKNSVGVRFEGDEDGEQPF